MYHKSIESDQKLSLRGLYICFKDDFNERAKQLMCKNLGFNTVVSIEPYNHKDDSKDPIAYWATNFTCAEKAQSFADCSCFIKSLKYDSCPTKNVLRITCGIKSKY